MDWHQFSNFTESNYRKTDQIKYHSTKIFLKKCFSPFSFLLLSSLDDVFHDNLRIRRSLLWSRILKNRFREVKDGYKKKVTRFPPSPRLIVFTTRKILDDLLKIEILMTSKRYGQTHTVWRFVYVFFLDLKINTVRYQFFFLRTSVRRQF